MENTLEKIHKATLHFLAPLAPQEVYKIIVEEAIKLVGAKYGSLLLLEEKELKRVYTTLPVASQLKIRKNGFTYTSFREQKAMIKKSRDFANTKIIWRLGLQSNIFIPLAYKSKSVGVLIVNSYENVEFTKKELHILKLFGSLASLAIRKTQLYDEATKALKTRDLFIAMAAHELRTPLTALNGYIQLLSNKLSGSKNSESRWIKQLSWESLRMTNLIKELLEVNQIKSGNLSYSFKECSLSLILQRSINNFKHLYPEREFIFKNDVGESSDTIIGDTDKLSQVVNNIIDNSVKFTSPNSKIFITLKYKKPVFNLKIKDFGLGIPKKDLPNIFETFYQGANHTREGIGMGLFIAQDIIKHHHGTIKAQSRVNKGTILEINLPKAKI